jgi:hypothetical protein
LQHIEEFTGHKTLSTFESYNTVDRDGRGAKLLHCYFVALGMKGFDPVRLDVIGGGNRIRTGE